MRCAAAFLPYTLTSVALVALSWFGLRAAWFWNEGRFVWLGRSIAIGVVCVTSLTTLHVAWSTVCGFLARRHFLTLLRQAEASLGLHDSEFHAPSEENIRTEAVRTVQFLPVLWGFLVIFTLLPVVGQIAGLAAASYLTSLLTARWLIEPLRRLRGLHQSGDGTFLDQHAWTLLPFGLSVLVVGAIPVLGALWNAGAAVGAVRLFRELDDRGGLTTARGWPLIVRPEESAQIPG